MSHAQETQSDSTPRARVVVWIVAAFALIWNGMGCINLIQQMSPAGVASLPEDYQSFIAARPAWGLWGFGLSVIAGVIAAILLFVRRRASVAGFGLSALGALVALIPTLDGASTAVIVGTALSVVLAGIFAWISSLTTG